MKTRYNHINYKKNEIGKDYVVGDLHGQIDMLYEMMEKIKFNKETDRMFSVGDLVDRGLDSYQTAMLVYFPWFKAVMGNHELMMVESIFPISGMYDSTNSLGLWLKNGGQWMHKYDAESLTGLAEELSYLPYIISIGEGDDRVNIVHAELVKTQYDRPVTDADIDNWNFNEWNLNSMVWGRTIIGYPAGVRQSKKLSRTFVGHTPVSGPRVVGQHYYIDTGACFYDYNGYTQSSLTIVSLNDDLIYNLNSLTKEFTVEKLMNIKRLPCYYDEEGKEDECI